MYRISKVDKGWIVERLEFKYSFLGLHFYKVWRPYVKVSGIDEFWYHSEKKYALMNLLNEIQKETYGLWKF